MYEKKIPYNFTILRSEFILYFPCRVKNAFLTTLVESIGIKLNLELTRSRSWINSI